MGEDRGNRPASGAKTLASRRCVVLVPRSVSSPAGLLEGLKARGMEVVAVGHPAIVMAEVALGGAAAVVVVEPRCVRRLGELVAALRRYYPRTVCWQYQSAGPGGESALSKLTDGAAPPEPKVDRGATTPGGPSTVPAPAARPALHRAAPGPDAVPQPLVTREELDMLIGRPFDDAPADAQAQEEDEEG